MAKLDNTAFDAALKVYFTDEEVQDLSFRDHGAYGFIRKLTSFTGKTYEQPITIGAVGGRSATAGEAVNAKNPSTHKRFSIPMTRNYCFADIDGLTLASSKSDRGAFMPALTTEVASCFTQYANDQAMMMYGSGTGLRGVVSAVAGAVITLTEIKDARNFEVGMTLEWATTETGVTLASGSKVVAVDRGLGTITVDLISSIIATHFLFQLGDAPNNTGNKKLVGFDGWLPETVPATAFFGVPDRTVDVDRLGRTLYDGTVASDDEEEILVKGAAKLRANGGRPDIAFISENRMANLDRLLEGRGRYEKTTSADGKIGFSSIVVVSGGGEIRVIGDPWCPDDVGYMLTSRDWVLPSVGMAPRLLDDDNNRILRATDDDAYEVRVGGYQALSCSAPGHSARLKFVP